MLVFITVIQNRKSSREIVTGKVFEYMALRRPVLGLLPAEDPLASIFRQCRLGLESKSWDTQSIESNLKEFFERWSQNALHPWKFNSREIEKYDRKSQAKVYSNLIKNLAG